MKLTVHDEYISDLVQGLVSLPVAALFAGGMIVAAGFFHDEL